MKLASEMVRIGKMAGRCVTALVTDMDQPLGHNIGNALEITEAADILKGTDQGRACKLCLEVAARMVMVGLNKPEAEAKDMVRSALNSGDGLKKLANMIAAQGGDARVLDDYALLPQAAHQYDIKAPFSGFVSSMKAQKLGLAANYLGAGRADKEESVDYAVGIVLHTEVGSNVQGGDTLATIYVNDASRREQAERMILDAIVLSDIKPNDQPLIYEIIE